MITFIFAAVLYTTTESEIWKETKVEPAGETDGIVLFDKTSEGRPFLAWGTTFNELDLDALRLQHLCCRLV